MKDHRIITPWGKAQTKVLITPWMFVVGTAGHGGVKLDRKHNAMIPKQYRRLGGWYEEDCEISIPLYFLYEQIIADRLGCEWLKIDKENAKQNVFRYFGE